MPELMSAETQAIIKRLRGTTEAASFDDILTNRPVGEVVNLVVDDMTWIVGFGYEQHPVGPCRHLSISHATRKMLPGTEITKVLLDAFGFLTPSKDIAAKVEIYPGRGLTAHIMQPL